MAMQALQQISADLFTPGKWLSLDIAPLLLDTIPTTPSIFDASCPNAQISCQNTSVVENLCCFNAPGGQLLLTQFWDTHPATGPDDAWTLHGLWPDRCDGSFEAYCDGSRHYNNITAILQHAGAQDLLDSMSTYWKDFRGHDATLWSHEWNKHGTCISTLTPSCYKNYPAQSEVVDFFRAADNLYRQLPTYEWLQDAGITPGSNERYARRDIEQALERKHGKPVTIKCRYGQLDEVWYHFAVKGSAQAGQYLPTIPDGPKGNCPAENVRYMPKRARATHTATATATVTSTHAAIPTGSRKPFEGRGYLMVKTAGVERGCIISNGQWFTSGSCATFVGERVDDGILLRSRKGNCLFSDHLKCAGAVHDGTAFQTADNLLLVAGSKILYADKIPHGFAKGTVYSGPRFHAIKLEISWRAV